MNASLPQALDQALAAAVRAPSPQNTQPWQFVVDGPRIEVWLDRERVLAVADPIAREARLSCGAAVYNLVLTLRVNGIRARVRVLPDPAERDLLAVISIEGNTRSSTMDRRLAEAVHRRQTNRRPMFDRPVPVSARAQLRSAALAEGGQLEFLDGSGRYAQVAALVRRAETAQSTDEEYLAEAASWTGRAADSPDGVPIVAFGPPAEGPGTVSLRSSHQNPSIAPRPFEQDPVLAAVLTRDRGTAAEVRAGMIMQRVLLTATAEGLATSFLSQPFEARETRTHLLEVFHRLGDVHTLLRIGYGLPTRMTARRPAAEVTTVRTPAR
ncbi:Acg family FMN-binding oxidoreductase [Amycolatopsis benzoatilytica]|uniref:Acg family FMN-binding oxidoreductase n=1 Tax=Amycolatopsis benzoatilytica TaxID=346045 RepID=UPI00036A3ABD|nr:nitroreductase family protein [Amycolatopsis benzoatilytica]